MSEVQPKSQITISQRRAGVTILSSFERFYIVTSLLYFAGGLTPSATAENQHSHTIDRMNSLFQLFVFPILVALIAVHWRELSRNVRNCAMPLVFCALACFSSLWSPTPGFTLRRSAIMLGFTLFSLYVGCRFTLPEQIDIYGWMSVTFVVATYILMIIEPEWGLSTGNHWGSWKGVFGHKNTLGRMALFGVVVLLVGRPSAVPKPLRGITTLGSLALIGLSGSATSVMAAGLVAAVCTLLPILKIRRLNTVPLWLVVLPLTAFVVGGILLNFGSLLESVGRDPTLTGRTTLWTAILAITAKRPVTGFGYAAFWHYNGPERAALFDQVRWTPPHAHNAYLDMCLDLGYIGLALLIYMIAVTFSKAARLYRISRNRAGAFPLACIVFVISVNCTESDLFRTHSFLWCPLVAIYASLKLLDIQATDMSPVAARCLAKCDLRAKLPILRSHGAAGSVGMY